MHTALLFGAVWWVWIDTSWVTNWLDPDLPPVRLMLLALMLGGLVVAAAIPAAFGSRGLIFAVCYALMQVGRSLFMLWALRGRSPGNFRNFQRITVWMAASAVFWLAGVWRRGLAFRALGGGLALDLGSAWLGFWVPGLGRSTTADWDVAGGHLAERGGFRAHRAGRVDHRDGRRVFSGGVVGLGGSGLRRGLCRHGGDVVDLFRHRAEHGSRRIEESADPGHLARLVYTYVHAVIVAAVILGAVADEMALAEPGLRASGAFLWVVLAAPVLYLVGNILFKRVVMGRLPLSHLVGFGLLVLLGGVAAGMSLLWLNAATSIVLVVVAVWEMRSYRRGRRRSRPRQYCVARGLDPRAYPLRRRAGRAEASSGRGNATMLTRRVRMLPN